MAFIKSLSRLLSPAKPAPQLYLAAFGKHPGWNDHTDDLGLDTAQLVNAKRLLYIQGISQNIDSGAWDKIDAAPQAARENAASVSEPSDSGDDSPSTATTVTVAPVSTESSPEVPPTAPPTAAGRLELFRHDFLWHMPQPTPILLAGRLWSSSDGKGRDKYPMVLCSQLSDLSAQFAVRIVLPFLGQVQERCVAATTASAVRGIIDSEREILRSRISENIPPHPLTAKELIAIANHPDLQPNREGFLRIVYQFASGGGGMSTFRPVPAKNAAPRRPEQVRLPNCGLSPQEALLFWLRFALTFLDPSTPMLLFAPDQGAAAPWVDLIAGEPAPGNLFCIKAGAKTLPFTSDIPYTLDPSFVHAVESHLSACTNAPEGLPVPPWPV